MSLHQESGGEYLRNYNNSPLEAPFLLLRDKILLDYLPDQHPMLDHPE